jgi:hypothetical protein
MENNQDVKNSTEAEAPEATEEQTVNQDSNATDSEETSTSTNESEAVETEKPAEPKKRYVPLEELQRERQKRRGLEERLEKLEENSNAPKADPVKELMEDLQVDEDTARKLHKHGLGNRGAESPQTKLQKLQSKFIEKANDVSVDYEDWDDYRDDMAKLLEVDYATDPFKALNTNPETYYLKARVQRGQSDKESSVKEAINKSNSKNLASVESGKNSGSKPSAKPRKGTRAWLSALTPEQYMENKTFIDAELMSGGFKE